MYMKPGRFNQKGCDEKSKTDSGEAINVRSPIGNFAKWAKKKKISEKISLSETN